jgi:hypothetical protein
VELGQAGPSAGFCPDHVVDSARGTDDRAVFDDDAGRRRNDGHARHAGDDAGSIAGSGPAVGHDPVSGHGRLITANT